MFHEYLDMKNLSSVFFFPISLLVLTLTSNLLKTVAYSDFFLLTSEPDFTVTSVVISMACSEIKFHPLLLLFFMSCENA